jgi:hypothetical protein
MSIQPFPLSQIGAMVDKQNLACIAGTLTAIYKPKSGENSTGPWSIQNAVLKGIDGTEVTIWVKDREEIPQNAKGRFIVLTARQGEKGLSGLYIMDDDYNGKITRKIKVTPTAELSYQEGGATQAAPQQSAPAQTTQASARQQAVEDSWADNERQAVASQQPTQASAPAKKPAPDSMIEAERTILQIVNLHLTCSRAVVKYEAPTFKKMTGQDMTESQVQGAIASVFIESCKNALHRHMPSTAMND